MTYWDCINFHKTVVLKLSWTMLFETVWKVCMKAETVLALWLMDDATWQPFVSVRVTNSRTNFFMITAEIVLIIFVMDDVICFFWENVCMTHSRTIKFYDYSWDGAYIVMGDAIWNRLQLCALPIPGQSESMVIAEMVPTLSWTMLF